MTAVSISGITEPLDLDKAFEVIFDIMRQVAKFVKKASTKHYKVEVKDHWKDFRTDADLTAERMIIEGLNKHFPDHKIISEENFYDNKATYVELTDDPTWIIDPIDGTMNFIHKFPMHTNSVALFLYKRPEIAVINNPSMDACYYARRGKGAFLNGERIFCSKRTKLEEALLIHELGSGIDRERLRVIVENSYKLTKKSHGLRSIGSAAMSCCLIACGAIDACYMYGLHIWDFAAGVLLVTEAGGVAIDPDGSELDYMARRLLVASTIELANELAANLNPFKKKLRDDAPDPATIKQISATKSTLSFDDCICNTCKAKLNILKD